MYLPIGPKIWLSKLGVITEECNHGRINDYKYSKKLVESHTQNYSHSPDNEIKWLLNPLKVYERKEFDNKYLF